MSKVRTIVGPTILTHSGHYFDFEMRDLGPNPVSDIAAALSKICRFTGHCREFYSVAEHSVHVSMIVPDHLALIGLMHDAAEAYIGDMAKPLKEMIPQYKMIEGQVEDAIEARLGVPRILPAEVKAADMTMLRVEQKQAMGNDDDWHWTGDDKSGVTLQFWDPRTAEIAFLKRYNQLMGSSIDAGRPMPRNTDRAQIAAIGGCTEHGGDGE